MTKNKNTHRNQTSRAEPPVDRRVSSVYIRAIAAVIVAALVGFTEYVSNKKVDVKGNPNVDVNIVNRNEIVPPAAAERPDTRPPNTPRPQAASSRVTDRAGASPEDEPDFCAVSRSQTLLHILVEAEAQFARQDYVAALQRYRCAEDRIAAERRRPARAQVLKTLRVENRTPLEIEKSARELYELFKETRIQLEE